MEAELGGEGEAERMKGGGTAALRGTGAAMLSIVEDELGVERALWMEEKDER